MTEGVVHSCSRRLNPPQKKLKSCRFFPALILHFILYLLTLSFIVRSASALLKPRRCRSLLFTTIESTPEKLKSCRFFPALLLHFILYLLTLSFIARSATALLKPRRCRSLLFTTIEFTPEKLKSCRFFRHSFCILSFIF